MLVKLGVLLLASLKPFALYAFSPGLNRQSLTKIGITLKLLRRLRLYAMIMRCSPFGADIAAIIFYQTVRFARDSSRDGKPGSS